MAKVLVHVHTGPADRNKVTLACLVAVTAAMEGHAVTVFFAGDGVHCLAPVHADVEGEGTGRLGNHLEALAASEARLLVSGKSAKARGYDDTLVTVHGAEFAMPQALVAAAVAADTVLAY